MISRGMNTTKRSARTVADKQVAVPCSGQVARAIAEGPFYKPNSPERTRLHEEGIPGERLTLTGHVLDAGCKPVAGAWLDFWQANGKGRYDNSGYTLRGHQYTDESGRYVLETVIPGGYSTRTPHIHVKIRLSSDSPILTTQLFFPGLASNEPDFLFDQTMVMDLQDIPGGKLGTFDFALRCGEPK